MAITPGAGYQVDPTNPNKVIPIGSPSMQNNPNAGLVATGVAPTPATQTNTPPAATQTPPPNPVTVNVGTPTATNTPTTPQTPTQNATNALTMPQNQSVVDLLNSAGTDSSYGNRQHLAQQFGIQGYSGSASQNKELAQKYLDFYNTKKGTESPATNPRQDIQEGTQTQTGEADPEKSFFDQYMAMNPVVKTMYDQINNALSSTATHTSLKDEYQTLVTAQGIPGLQTELMNLKNIMDGTEDDIRTEVEKAGGFATDSQVQALAGARNKVLMKQATSLQQQLQMKDDYVNQIMQFSQLDRKDVEDQLNQKLGLTEKLISIQDKITSAATSNYKEIVKNVGYQGLAAATASNPTQRSLAESALGLPKGALSNPTFIAKESTGKPLQFVSGTDNQRAGVFDPNTGKFTPLGGSSGSGGTPANANTDAYVQAFNNAIAGMGPQAAKQAQAIFNGYMQSGDFVAAKNYIIRQAMANAPADQQNQAVGRTQAITALKDIQGLLEQAKANGNATGLVEGNVQDIAEKFGKQGNADLAYIGNRIASILQTYRRAMTGVAFSPGESAQYEKIFPSTTKNGDLNTTKISALIDSLNSNNKATIGFYIGDSNYDKLFSDVSTTNLPSSHTVGTIVHSGGQDYEVGQDGKTLVPINNGIDWNALTIK